MTDGRSSTVGNDPTIVHRVVTIAPGKGGELCALRDDGAVFILLRSGVPFGYEINEQPRWVEVPAIPGTLRAIEQEG
jgi:hypothetical protein